MRKERTATLVRGARKLLREGERKMEAIHVQLKPRSCGWGATHLRPADSTKLPTETGSKWVCVGIEKGKQKAEGHEKEVRKRSEEKAESLQL